ncbi:MAG: hypothetical protein Q7U35_06295 [Methanobacteriaceae archaeon]|nr:hypothetical protein [Methanobacteriaceae archaeon]MDP2835866.1 hypothetical protein [Methanobacteriaceae archaeon]MDP3034667.1 hypothetical protein [Methanobacteriaceae archaeon]MDP3486149.1 hypothetical protein [Methanobacteriaceae archaeon]MDP3622662.1 hypothetical protein [Methanobacteriaceae archaeon]
MQKNLILLLVFILCASFLTAHPVAAATQDKIQTMIIVDTMWDTGQNVFDPTVWLYTETYVIDIQNGGQLDHKLLRYELYNPDGVLCEVQKHKTGRAWYNLHRDISAKADFQGPFKGQWTLKVFFDGDDEYAPCQKSLSISHENYDYPWGGAD